MFWYKVEQNGVAPLTHVLRIIKRKNKISIWCRNINYLI